MNWCRETRAYKEKITTSSETDKRSTHLLGVPGGGEIRLEGDRRRGGSVEGDQWWATKMVTDSTLTFKAHLCRMQP